MSEVASVHAAVRQIDAGLLDVGYVDAGPADGPAVVLLHGWPYDIHSFDDVVPVLAAAGHRVIVPYLRGFGTTRFLPAITIGSDFDGANADGHAYAHRFSGPYSHRVLPGIGHNAPQEAPEAFAHAILEVGGAR